MNRSKPRNLKPLRILLVSPLPPPVGGIASWSSIVLREFSARGSLEMHHANTALRWKGQGVKSRFFRISGGVMQACRDIVSVGFSIVFTRPHVLHLTTSAAYASLKDALILFIARTFSVVGVIHYHTSYLGSLNVADWRFRAARLAMRMANAVVVLDPKTYGKVECYLPSGKLYKIPNMIDLNRIDTLGTESQQYIVNRYDTEVQCIFVGRVVIEKGIVELVKACSQIQGIQLHLVGPVEKEFRMQLQKISLQRPKDSWLHFHGQLNNEEACAQIKQSDIVVLPSYFEGFPLVILESMALYKPVVATDVGAISEMLDVYGEQACGVCVAPRDVDGLQKTLLNLKMQPTQRSRMGYQGRKRVERLYSTQAVMKQLESLWRETSRKQTGVKPSPYSLKLDSLLKDKVSSAE